MVKRILTQVAHKAFAVLKGGNAVQHPAAVGPPEAAAGIVVVVGLIGKFVVVAVQSHPFQGPCLAGQGAHQHQDPF